MLLVNLFGIYFYHCLTGVGLSALIFTTFHALSLYFSAFQPTYTIRWPYVFLTCILVLGAFTYRASIQHVYLSRPALLSLFSLHLLLDFLDWMLCWIMIVLCVIAYCRGLIWLAIFTSMALLCLRSFLGLTQLATHLHFGCNRHGWVSCGCLSPCSEPLGLAYISYACLYISLARS